MKRKILGMTVAIIVIISLLVVNTCAEEKDSIEKQFKKIYKIYKEQFGEIPEEQLKKISKKEFIEAYEKGFRGHASSKENIRALGSCFLGECRVDLWWYKPPHSFKIHHWAKSVGDAYQLCDFITAGGSVYGATAFVYEHTAYNTAWTSAEGDAEGHYDWNFWGYKAVNHAHAKFVVDGVSEWANDTVSGPERHWPW